MRRSAAQTTLYVLAILLIGMPFAFAFLRAFVTQSDFRYLWVALASFVSVAVVMAVGKASLRKPAGMLTLSVTAMIAGAAVAAVVAFLTGATAPLAVATVAVGFAMCHAAGYALHVFSRPPSASTPDRS